MSSIITETCRRVGAVLLESFCDSNGYQGQEYFLVMKDNKFSLCSVHFGTCELCDWRMSLAEDYRRNNNTLYSDPIPLSAFEPMIEAMVSEITQLNFHNAEDLINQFDMLFGVGYSEELVRDQVTNYIRSYNGS